MNLLKNAWKNRKQISEAVTNVVFSNARIEDIRTRRMAICASCMFNSDNARRSGYKSARPDAHCISCGCNLGLKTSCLSCSCPLDPPLWGIEEATEHEEEAPDGKQ